jgi:hypothetical protein
MESVTKSYISWGDTTGAEKVRYTNEPVDGSRMIPVLSKYNPNRSSNPSSIVVSSNPRLRARSSVSLLNLCDFLYS